MKIYIELHISGLDEPSREIIMAKLSEVGYYGFLEESDTELKAYILLTQYNQLIVDEIKQEFPFSYKKKEIREENWNASWESSFSPVIVDDYVSVRADFHEVVKNVEHEIVITPKMSFGTGHHATTFLMIREMRRWDWKGKKVLDFGTGTGILAILAEKSGAINITAIDNDPWSIENAGENVSNNGCHKINLLLSSELAGREKYDLILANINKHILLEYSEILGKILLPGGVLIMSGLLKDDRADIIRFYIGGTAACRSEK
jgi:ribosomal protein L11 methyltransferase